MSSNAETRGAKRSLPWINLKRMIIAFDNEVIYEPEFVQAKHLRVTALIRCMLRKLVGMNVLSWTSHEHLKDANEAIGYATEAYTLLEEIFLDSFRGVRPETFELQSPYSRKTLDAESLCSIRAALDAVVVFMSQNIDYSRLVPSVKRVKKYSGTSAEEEDDEDVVSGVRTEEGKKDTKQHYSEKEISAFIALCKAPFPNQQRTEDMFSDTKESSGTGLLYPQLRRRFVHYVCDSLKRALICTSEIIKNELNGGFSVQHESDSNSKGIPSMEPKTPRSNSKLPLSRNGIFSSVLASSEQPFCSFNVGMDDSTHMMLEARIARYRSKTTSIFDSQIVDSTDVETILNGKAFDKTEDAFDVEYLRDSEDRDVFLEEVVDRLRKKKTAERKSETNQIRLCVRKWIEESAHNAEASSTTTKRTSGVLKILPFSGLLNTEEPLQMKLFNDT